MRIDMSVWLLRFFPLVLTLILTGCGQQSTNLTLNDDESNSGLPLLAVPQPNEGKSKSKPTPLLKNPFKKKTTAKGDETVEEESNSPDKGSPEWLLAEMQRIRLLPLPHEESKEDDDDDDDKQLTPEQEEKLAREQEKKFAQEIERTMTVRRERNRQIVKLAEECMQKTSKNPDQEAIFCSAVTYFLDARFQLALQKDTPSIEALYEADKILYDRNSKSKSAAEAAMTLVNLTHANARSYGLKDPRWLKEFSKQTQSYVNRFPDEAHKSVPMLMAAARTCELNKQTDEARACYQLLDSKFKETPFGEQAGNALRRLGLKGQAIELSGPGIDGSDIDIRSMKGKMVLVVFWESNAQPFVQQLPKLLEITRKCKNFMTVVGINLDTDEKLVDAFQEKYSLEWQQIFPENRQQRGWNSPLAIRYGVYNLPTMFLIDPKGIVAETELDASNLEAKIREVAEPYRKKAPAQK